MVGLFISASGTLNLIEDEICLNKLKILFNISKAKMDESGVLVKITQNYFFIIGSLMSF